MASAICGRFLFMATHKRTEQEIQNLSFDETTQTSVVLPLEYDPSGATKRTITGNLATKIVISGTDIYVGKATIGSSTASAVWQVKKIDTASDIIITWADGDAEFDNSMSNPSSLTYS